MQWDKNICSAKDDDVDDDIAAKREVKIDLKNIYSDLALSDNNGFAQEVSTGLSKSSNQCDQIGQIFKACGNNYFAQITHICIQYFVKASKTFIFWWKHF